jgi:nucleoside-diphosphate-sugar epimerase
MNILVLGGSGGIGHAMVNKLRETYPEATIHATYKHHQPDTGRGDGVIWHRLDITFEEEIKQLSQNIPQLDWLINCIGMLHTEDKGPEKKRAGTRWGFFPAQYQA